MPAKKQDKEQDQVAYTKYEKARILGSRALQISMGAPFLVKVSKQQLKELKYNVLEIAKLEFEKGVIPLTVKRPMPRSKYVEAQEKEQEAEN